jgi:hypothetical protein
LYFFENAFPQELIGQQCSEGDSWIDESEDAIEFTDVNDDSADSAIQTISKH